MEENQENIRFKKAFDVVMKHEGGLVNSPNDPGGITNFGISLRFLLASGIDINHDFDINSSDIIDLTKDQAKEIYKKYWWDKYRYNEIIYLDVAIKIFDLAINMGAIQAHKLVQRAINSLDNQRQTSVNGILGQKTLAAINAISPMHLLAAIKKEASKFYTLIAERNPNLKIYLNGWLRRAND